MRRHSLNSQCQPRSALVDDDAFRLEIISRTMQSAGHDRVRTCHSAAAAGCHPAHGYFIAKPMPGADLPARLEN